MTLFLLRPHLHYTLPGQATGDQYRLYYDVKIGWLRVAGQWRISTGVIDEEALTRLAVEANNFTVLNF